MEPEILENEGIPKMKENRKLPETALIIETFNRVCGVDNRAKSRRELENRNNSFPIRTPRFHCVRIFFCPFKLDLVTRICGKILFVTSLTKL